MTGSPTAILFISISFFTGCKRIFHQGGNGHGTDAARNRGNITAKGRNLIEFDISLQGKSALFRGIRHPGNSYIYDDSALLYHRSPDKLRPAQGRHDDIRLQTEPGNIPGLGMTKGYRAIARVAVAAEQDAHGSPDDIAPSDHDGVHPPGVDLVMLQQEEDAMGSGRDIGGKTLYQPAYILGMEAIYILGRMNGIDHFLVGNMFGQR